MITKGMDRHLVNEISSPLNLQNKGACYVTDYTHPMVGSHVSSGESKNIEIQAMGAGSHWL